MTEHNVVYRMRDAEGVLLYVGLTLSATSRFRAHGREKPWWSEVRSIEIEPFDTRTEAAAAELCAIAAERPRYNIVGREVCKVRPRSPDDSQVVEVGRKGRIYTVPAGSSPEDLQVIQRLIDAGNVFEQSKRDFRQAILDAYADLSMTMAEIEEISGCSRQHISRLAKDAGLTGLRQRARLKAA